MVVKQSRITESRLSNSPLRRGNLPPIWIDNKESRPSDILPGGDTPFSTEYGFKIHAAKVFLCIITLLL